MGHVVELIAVEPRPTAVVQATTTWRDFPSQWKGMLDEVWSCLNAGGIIVHWVRAQNVFCAAAFATPPAEWAPMSRVALSEARRTW